MKTRILLAVLFCAVSVIQAGQDQGLSYDFHYDLNINTNLDLSIDKDISIDLSTDYTNCTDPRELSSACSVLTPSLMKKTAGVSILCFELIGVPVLQKYVFWHRPPGAYTAFKFDETEPYLMDKSLHFIGGAVMTELNYHLLKESFGFEDPVFAAGAASLAFWTAMECLDGVSSVGFSVRDQIGNTLGTLYGIFRLKYPDFPIYIRAGVDDMKRTVQWARSGFSLTKYGTDYYSMTKTELIYMFDNNLYAGAALSKGIGKNNHDNRFGICAGYDFLNGIEKKDDTFLYKVLGLGQRYASVSICVTYWNR